VDAPDRRTEKADKSANVTKAKPTHQNIIRLAPPLVITEEEIKLALQIIGDAVKELPTFKENKD